MPIITVAFPFSYYSMKKIGKIGLIFDVEKLL